MSDCLFCKIRDGEIPCNIAYEDEEILACDANPSRLGFQELSCLTLCLLLLQWRLLKF